MKKTIAALMSLTAACAMLTPAFAAGTESPAPISQPPAVISEAPEETTGRCTFEINGKDVPVDAVIIVPLRAIAEPLGFKVTWDNGRVLVDDGTMHTTVTIGVDSYIVTTSADGMDGMSAPFSLGAAPYVVDGTTYGMLFGAKRTAFRLGQQGPGAALFCLGVPGDSSSRRARTCGGGADGGPGGDQPSGRAHIG